MNESKIGTGEWQNMKGKTNAFYCDIVIRNSCVCNDEEKS
jgi:hypothetical protein